MVLPKLSSPRLEFVWEWGRPVGRQGLGQRYGFPLVSGILGSVGIAPACRLVGPWEALSIR